MRLKFLIVEDEPKTGDYLRQGLSEAGYVVDLARDGTDGLHLALTEDYDLKVLDVMPPGLNGWQVLQGIARVASICRCCFSPVDDRVKGPDLSADGYLVKPFAFSELLARARTLLRRGKEVESVVLCVTWCTSNRGRVTLPPVDSANLTASVLNSSVYRRFGTESFFLIFPSVHQKTTKILMYVKPGQGHTGKELLGIRYYGCSIDDLNNHRRPHQALGMKTPAATFALAA